MPTSALNFSVNLLAKVGQHESWQTSRMDYHELTPEGFNSTV